MVGEQYWLIREISSEEFYHYTGYFESGKPVFTIAIADAVQIASYQSTKIIFNILKKNLHCEIWLIENGNWTKVHLLADVEKDKPLNPVS
ncbi:hypothetical protein [Mucilaginibacter sp. UYCu711]|uniref:hypothetical protein n=1 Tax=Mucilaginibacter sp. UYCu711 TaxID=3156339 RepID=UPI003D252954